RDVTGEQTMISGPQHPRIVSVVRRNDRKSRRGRHLNVGTIPYRASVCTDCPPPAGFAFFSSVDSGDVDGVLARFSRSVFSGCDLWLAGIPTEQLLEPLCLRVNSRQWTRNEPRSHASENPSYACNATLTNPAARMMRR